MGRFRSGTLRATITYAPVIMPAAPVPAIALPTMRTLELGVTPHIRLPSSNTKSPLRKVHFILSMPYMRPYVGRKEVEVMRYALAYQPTSLYE